MSYAKEAKMNEDELLLYLYRNVGLYWEKELSLVENKDRISLRSNDSLKTFIKSNQITYYITNANDITAQDFELNTFYMTETGATRVGSLIKHIRNSIMHGNYTIHFDNHIEINFLDKYRGRTTMKGRITLDKLQQLIDCTNPNN